MRAIATRVVTPPDIPAAHDTPVPTYITLDSIPHEPTVE